MVACARATKYAHEHHPEMQIGMMLCGGPDYPATCKPEDMLARLKAQPDGIFFSLTCSFVENIRAMRSVSLRIRASMWSLGIRTRKDLKNTADFFTFSYYYTQVCSKESYEKGNEVYRNKELPANPWGWTIDPVGFPILLNEVLRPLPEADLCHGEWRGLLRQTGGRPGP